MANNIPITEGAGTSSVAAEQIGTVKYQQIKVVGGEVGSSSVWGITPDGSGKVSVIGTVSATISSWQAPSIVGTYVEDAAHSSGDRGLFVLAVRNDTLSSVTSADADYSPLSVGPMGEVVALDAPITKWVSGVADLRVVQGASVVAITAPGASIFTYVREVQVANFGPSSVLVKIGGGLGSTLGWTIAPAGGGSNFTTRYKTGENSAVTASINGTASVLVTLSGFTAKT